MRNQPERPGNFCGLSVRWGGWKPSGWTHQKPRGTKGDQWKQQSPNSLHRIHTHIRRKRKEGNVFISKSAGVYITAHSAQHNTLIGVQQWGVMVAVCAMLYGWNAYACWWMLAPPSLLFLVFLYIRVEERAQSGQGLGWNFIVRYMSARAAVLRALF